MEAVFWVIGSEYVVIGIKYIRFDIKKGLCQEEAGEQKISVRNSFVKKTSISKLVCPCVHLRQKAYVLGADTLTPTRWGSPLGQEILIHTWIHFHIYVSKFFADPVHLFLFCYCLSMLQGVFNSSTVVTIKYNLIENRVITIPI